MESYALAKSPARRASRSRSAFSLLVHGRLVERDAGHQQPLELIDTPHALVEPLAPNVLQDLEAPEKLRKLIVPDAQPLLRLKQRRTVEHLLHFGRRNARRVLAAAGRAGGLRPAAPRLAAPRRQRRARA